MSIKINIILNLMGTGMLYFCKFEKINYAQIYTDDFMLYLCKYTFKKIIICAWANWTISKV
jgi:hypothetical protein